MTTPTLTLDRIRGLIRDVPDFPKPGIMFKDITPLIADPPAFHDAVELLGDRITRHGVDALVAIESRGFLFGAAVAHEINMPLQLVRKPGKLPFKKVGLDYALEYGTDRVEMHIDAVERGKRYAIVDDLIATGGTATAAVKLVEQQGGEVVCCAFVIELGFLGGAKLLTDYTIESLIAY